MIIKTYCHCVPCMYPTLSLPTHTATVFVGNYYISMNKREINCFFFACIHIVLHDNIKQKLLSKDFIVPKYEVNKSNQNLPKMTIFT